MPNPTFSFENSVPPVATAAPAGQLKGKKGTPDVVFPVTVSGAAMLNLPAATHIDDPTGGATTDAEARAAIVLILNALESAKIVAAA